jgi:hypothetical protein
MRLHLYWCKGYEMLNRSYQLRAVRKAGGGDQAAADLAMRLPWAGIFEPWRAFVLVAEANETLVTQTLVTKAAKPAARPRIAANRCKKSSGRLQGVQLELFADGVPSQSALGISPAGSDAREPAQLHIPVKNFSPESGRLQFPPLAEMEVPLNDDDRPLADLFPEAYL